MKIEEIKKKFIDFFKSKGHYHCERSLVVNKNDPTLMFTNAGMNQFKNYLTNPLLAPHARITTIQPCIRVSGKHNDLEDVGRDTYHHTLFEMLGNWSFGDFFKKEAIEWAWELLTEVYKIDKERIYVTTFGGEESESLEKDVESYEIWKKIIDPQRIIHTESKKNNFWEMGDSGPCGPSTEIHVDIRSEEEKKKIDGFTLVNKDHPQVIEVWNLVFVEYERLASGKLRALEKKCVDTGMGLERLAMVLQNKKSTYDTDIFSPIINFIEKKTSLSYTDREEVAIAMRVIVDHVRTISYSIADGQSPSNNKAGYVIRRILRRALRYGYSFLDLKKPFLHEVFNKYIDHLSNSDKALCKHPQYISDIIKNEEESFFKTLEQGLSRLDVIIKNSKTGVIAGNDVFEMFDTYGFPVDLTIMIARENNLDVDSEGFDKHMNEQKNRSKKSGEKVFEDWVIMSKSVVETNFTGYDNTSEEIKILKYRTYKNQNKEIAQLVFDKTPFYPEGGGQVGDEGYIESNVEKLYIFNTKKENGTIIHETEDKIRDPALSFLASICKKKREAASAHHTATHLLHASLRKILGETVEQKGSYVSACSLRLDFSCHKIISEEDLQSIEENINETIRKNIIKEELRSVSLMDAKKMGAMSLFGEKYGERVRVIKFEGVSIELCAGTHVKSTGELGFFKIVSCSSIAAGIRRIEAKVGRSVEKFLQDHFTEMKNIAKILKIPQSIDAAVVKLYSENKETKKYLEKYEDLYINERIKNIPKEKSSSGEFSIVRCSLSNLLPSTYKKIVEHIVKESSTVAVISYEKDNREFILIGVAENLVKEKKILVREILEKAKEKYDIRGGGSEHFISINFGKKIEKDIVSYLLKSIKG